MYRIRIHALVAGLTVVGASLLAPNAHSAGETRQKAQEHLMAISRNMEKEFELENLIKAKGFKDAAVLVDDRAVTVIVAAASLPAEESQRIKELVSKGTGVELQNIVVIHKYQ